jgi:hypothetical protein
MKPRNESSLVTAALNYLQCLENAKIITYCDRLNSGAAMVGKRRIRMCRKGTPDIMVILKNGNMLWVECKLDTGKLTLDQHKWKIMIQECEGHTHLVIRDLDGLQEHLNYLGVKC